jgi:hypothetical protein
MPATRLTAILEAEQEGRPPMKTTVRRVAGKLAGAIREMNDAQRRMMALRSATDRYAENSGAAPDTYAEFLVRTSGALLHEPPARKRLAKDRQR